MPFGSFVGPDHLGGDVAGNGISKLFFTIISAVAEAERDRIVQRRASLARLHEKVVLRRDRQNRRRGAVATMATAATDRPGITPTAGNAKRVQTRLLRHPMKGSRLEAQNERL